MSRFEQHTGRLSLTVLGLAVVAGCASSPAPPRQAPAAPAPQQQPVVVQQAPAPVPELRFKMIFADEFDTVRSEWQQVSGYWETAAGFLVQKTDDPRQVNAIRYILSPRVADATIETLVRINPTRPVAMTNSPQDAELMRNVRYIIGAGVVFRMKDPGNFYLFRLAGEEGAVLGRMQNGVWNEKDLCNPRVRDFLQGNRIGFSATNWYKLKVEAYGGEITVSIDDEPVCRATDNTFMIGQVGLSTFKTAADFDYIRIYNRNEPEIKAR
jgi:hypothetical protein